jgi:hypothetical protein
MNRIDRLQQEEIQKLVNWQGYNLILANSNLLLIISLFSTARSKRDQSYLPFSEDSSL